MKHLHDIDWKLLLFVFIACYAIPWLFIGTLVNVIFLESTEATDWRSTVAGAAVAACFLAAPAAAGYFTARFARNRPRLHVVLVVLVGIGAGFLVTRNSLSVHLVIAAVSLGMAALGAFVVLRGVQR